MYSLYAHLMFFKRFNSSYSQFTCTANERKGDIFTMHHGKIGYGESALNTNYTITNVTDCI